MKLTLDRIDLKPEFDDMHLQLLKFNHFKEDVQVAIKAAGQGTVFENDGRSYHAVYAPKNNVAVWALFISMIQFLIAALRANTTYEFWVSIALVFVLVGVLLIKLWRDYVH